MRLQLLPLLASTGVLAASWDNLMPRDVPTLTKRASSFVDLIVTDLTNLTTITEEITTQIKNFTDLNGAFQITKYTGYLIEAIDKAKMDAQSTMEALSASDAALLAPSTQFLAYAANASIAALIEKKPIFLNYSLSSTVVSSLQTQIQASNNFSNALFKHIPKSLLPVSVALNSQVDDSLNMGLACFQGKNASCITAVVNASRTALAAESNGAIPKSAAGRSVEISSMLGLGAAIAAGVLFAA